MIDPDGLNGGPIISNKVPPGGYTWTTYPERLEKAGISWKVYQQDDNYHHQDDRILLECIEHCSRFPFHVGAIGRGGVARSG